MATENPNLATEKEHDAVAESLARPNAWSKPASMGNKSSSRVWIRPILDKKKVKIRKKRKNHDYRDVTFY